MLDRKCSFIFIINLDMMNSLYYLDPMDLPPLPGTYDSSNFEGSVFGEHLREGVS